ncbi:type III pantothenate kinase [candidate division KSB1 bacterium]|nr:MAG: type III pantothenate kinase [candidate division KSB1 bacterium]
MLLVIDVGNTETVFGVYENKTLVFHGRVSSRINRTSDESWILLNMMLKEKGIEKKSIDSAVISSVVPSLTQVFKEMVQTYMSITPVEVSSEIETGIVFKYASPSSIGADRICNAVAGYKLFGGPVIILDFGTATTFDVVTEKGEYTGGVIALGLKGISQELHRLAAKLPRVDMVFPDNVIGDSTESAMQSGIMWGSVSLVDGIIKKIKKEIGRDKITVVATGGMASVISEKSEMINRVEPFLILEGMRILYYLNIPQKKEES